MDNLIFKKINPRDIDKEEWIEASKDIYGVKYRDKLVKTLNSIDMNDFPVTFIYGYKTKPLRIVCRCILSITNHVYGFIVDENHRHKGYGKIMLDYIINECNGNNLNISLDTTNLNMKALVESKGFELISIGKDDTTLTKDYHMVKKIR